MSKKPFTKITVYFVLCSVYLFSFAHFGVYAYDHLTSPPKQYIEGTMIGGINVSNSSEEEALTKLTEKTTLWKKNQKLSFSYLEEQIPFDSGLFHFDEQSTITNAIQGKDTPLAVK